MLLNCVVFLFLLPLEQLFHDLFLNRPVWVWNNDKGVVGHDNVGFGEDDDGVEDKDFESVTVNSWSFSVSEDTGVE
ncbi:hypothetical protein Tco_0999309 [Tanacetum coccineum]